MPKRTLEQRLSDNIRISFTDIFEGTPCWLWIGPRKQEGAGHGQASAQGKTEGVHRIVFKLLIGDLPPGIHGDHRCPNKHCCNPWHLDPVTPAENTRRWLSSAGTHTGGVRSAEKRRAKTHCVRGHEFNKKNTYYSSDGRRDCLECKRQRTYASHVRTGLIKQTRQQREEEMRLLAQALQPLVRTTAHQRYVDVFHARGKGISVAEIAKQNDVKTSTIYSTIKNAYKWVLTHGEQRFSEIMRRYLKQIENGPGDPGPQEGDI